MNMNKLYRYVEINIMHDNKTISSTCMDINNKEKIKIGKHTYNIILKDIFLYPTKDGFNPALFYKEGEQNPVKFKNKNKGIPSRALHLLWNHSLYKVLVTPESDKANLIIIILILGVLITFAIEMYLMYG